MKTLKRFEGWGIMYNTYTIGELAKILGITAETIRYYERKGIIAPIHDQESGYRYYTTWDLHMLIRARCYLGFGLSIEETGGILQSKSLEEIDDLLEKQNALLAKEKQLMNRRSSLRSVEDKEMLRQYRALKKRLSDTPDWDDRFEIYQEELNTFLKQMPEGMLKAEEERQQINAILQEIRHEKRIVNRIVEEERSMNKEQKISKTERTEIRHRR